jgi:hypothetical protein
MEKQSKKELLAVIERQGDQLKRFEARLRGTRIHKHIPSIFEIIHGFLLANSEE